MPRTMPMVLTVTVLAATALLAGREAIPSEEQDPLSLHFAGTGPRSLEIDTVWGSIDVATHAQSTVDVVARRTVSAKTAEAREAAGREVHLQVTDNAPALRLYVDGPFRRCDCEGSRRDRWRNPGYEVRYDFEVRVPRDVSLRLGTVNDGHVRLQGTDGSFEVRNVNGGIELIDIGGAGEARTVNGDVTATYRAIPPGDLRLVTLNGDVVARFGAGLSADVWVKTTNGGVFTDFEYTRLPSQPPASERRGSMKVWRTSPSTGVRVGGGGRSFQFETFNGDIRILRSVS